MGMKGKEFVEKLNEKKKGTLLENDQFVIVGQNTEDGVEDTAIVLYRGVVTRVVCSFCYDSNELIYNLSFGSIGFNELIDLTDLIKKILDSYN